MGRSASGCRYTRYVFLYFPDLCMSNSKCSVPVSGSTSLMDTAAAVSTLGSFPHAISQFPFGSSITPPMNSVWYPPARLYSREKTA